ncbi:MAG: methyltransferase domain-containing protein [Candidatus Pacebacteria bacterium]|nr:methyltransferase domain-containing protein [Candidatus Paceibacterota bacterium]
MIKKGIFKNYFSFSYRRKALDKLLEKNKNYYKGIVLDVGGRDRGNFEKPKTKVEKWIFADIISEHNPDVVLDVANMQGIESETIDVVNAIELFEHVEQIESGLKECYRVLKKGGVMILSCPFLTPLHGDPFDFQRWTETKWKNKLKENGFVVEKFEITGFYFTILADFKKALIRSLPKVVSYFCKLFYPLLDLVISLDKTRWVLKNPKLNKFHNGYFIVVRKL